MSRDRTASETCCNSVRPTGSIWLIERTTDALVRGRAHSVGPPKTRTPEMLEMRHKVLDIEDSIDLAEVLPIHLRDANVEVARDGRTGLGTCVLKRQ